MWSIKIEKINCIMCFFSDSCIQLLNRYGKYDRWKYGLTGKQDKRRIFPLYIDEMKGIGYLPMKEFLYTIELNDIEVDFQNKMIKGMLPNKKKIQWKFDSDISFVENEELYIEIEQLGKVFSVKNVKFDLAMLNINIQFDFKIPADIRYEQEQKRRSMSKSEKAEKKQEYIDNKSFFSPGVIQVEYEKNDLEKSGEVHY